MPNYSTQYNPYLDMAGAAQGPASGLMRVLTELPQQRAQARLLGSQVDENTARIGLMGQQGMTEQAQQQRLGAEAGMFGAHTRLYDADAANKEMLGKIAAGLGTLSGQAAQQFSTGKIGPEAKNFVNLLTRINALENAPGKMKDFTQSVGLMAAGGDPTALANVQSGGRGIPFGRSVGNGITTPTVLPEGASLLSGTQGTNAPTIVATAPRAFNPGSTASVDAARISARARLTAESLRQLGDAGAPPEQIQQLLQQALQEFNLPSTNAPVRLPQGTNAPVRIHSITPIP